MSVGIKKAFPNAEITGVDLYPQKNYPFKFIQADALKFPLEGYDFIWASPPCQAFSSISNLGKNSKKHKKLIRPVRQRLIDSGIPYVIENVMGAKKELASSAVVLCGGMFNLEVYRHRLFEASFILSPPDHVKHVAKCTPLIHRRPRKPGEFLTITSHFGCSLADARKAMGIEWMDRDDLPQAIPPAYSEYILNQWKKAFK